MIEKDGTGLISRWNSAFLHTLEDLVTPEFLQPSFEFPAAIRKIPLSSPLFIVPAAGIRDDKPACGRRGRSRPRCTREGNGGVEMAVHGWPTALCELFQAQVTFEACARARIYTHTRVRGKRERWLRPCRSGMRLMDKRVGARKRRTPVRSRERVQPTINNERAESVAESVVFVCRFHAVIVLDLLSLSLSFLSPPRSVSISTRSPLLFPPPRFVFVIERRLCAAAVANHPLSSAVIMRNLRGAHHRRDRRVAVSWIEDDDDALKGASIYIFLLYDFLRLENIREILCKIEIAINPSSRGRRRLHYNFHLLGVEGGGKVNLDALFFEEVEFIG